MKNAPMRSWIVTNHGAPTILEAFATFPVFSLYLRYAVIDGACRLFVDDADSPLAWMLFAPPGVFFQGVADPDLIASLRARVPEGSWIISPDGAWDDLLQRAFPTSLKSFPRGLFDAKDLDLGHIRRVRSSLPEGLKIEPIATKHLGSGILKREILERFFAKRPFPTHGFGFALVDAADILHGFALTNYPLDGGRDVEVSFRVGTNQDERYRGQGIATTLASHFLEEAMVRGYVPQWDAANEISAHIARKFGYKDLVRWHMHHLVSATR